MRPLLLLTILATTACVTTETSAPYAAPGAQIQSSSATRAWEVVDSGTPIGSVVRFEAPGKPGEPSRFLYTVRNTYSQDLGLVDALGRAWRQRPFQDDAEWIGTGTVLEGVRGILGAGPEALLREVSPGVLEAAAKRPSIE